MHALLAALYLQVGLAADHSVSPPTGRYSYWAYDLNVVRNPYGIAEVGIETDPSRSLQLQLALRHVSSLPARDHGINSMEVRLKWKPFRQ